MRISIVVAWAEKRLMFEHGEGRLSMHELCTASACLWRCRSVHSVQKAQAYCDRVNAIEDGKRHYVVLTYPETVKDPIEQAKIDALRYSKFN
jgi:hypothetical protein